MEDKDVIRTHDKNATTSVSESENPVIPAPTPKRTRPRTNKRLVAESTGLVGAASALVAVAIPLGADFDYREKAFASLDVKAVKADIQKVLTTPSQEWWPADYGRYGPFFIRMAWHSAGTYRLGDGRGGADERPATLRAAEQLARQREPRQSAAVALAHQAEVRPEDLVGRPHGAHGQRRPRVHGLSDVRLRRRAHPDEWQKYQISCTGAPRRRCSATPATPAIASSRGRFGAVQMGLIYVNAEGPNGNPNPLARRQGHPRRPSSRMAMDDEETVALIVGGHAFGKAHGAATSAREVRRARSPGIERRRSNKASAGTTSDGTGKGKDAVTSGLEGAWSATPTA